MHTRSPNGEEIIRPLASPSERLHEREINERRIRPALGAEPVTTL